MMYLFCPSGRLLDVGVSVLLFEPDAVWTTNPLEDGLFSYPLGEVVVFRNVPETHQVSQRSWFTLLWS